jgi:hypothetical protein
MEEQKLPTEPINLKEDEKKEFSCSEKLIKLLQENELP